MAIKKHPYELSIWIERLNGSNSKIEEKGAIIGAHDMTFPGKATNITLTRYLKGTNTLSFQMPDKYFDSLRGEFVHNEFVDVLAAETKIKLFYKDRWFEFFVKKVSEKKQFKSIMKTFTCSDAFIDELSRNGYGITFSTDLYNNVEEAGTFTTEVLEDSIWTYHPQHNWGDFTEFKEEKLFKIPVSQFKYISGYKLNFDVDYDSLPQEVRDIFISNVYTGEERAPEMSDDLARGAFWDQYNGDSEDKLNPLTRDFVQNIPNDGYIYVPYTCLNFCYGSDLGPDQKMKYDRAATEIALTNSENELIIAPDSVDPRTIIQFIAFPANTPLEIDDAGVILNKDYSYFITLEQWNEMVIDREEKGWYIFEDTRLVKAEVLGASDLADAEISHTFRYLSDSPEGAMKFYGNKWVTYDGYLSDLNNNLIVKGKKFSITDRSEINISKDIDQYVTVYNNHSSDYYDAYMNAENWTYDVNTDGFYRVCSKLATRQIIPQLARNLVQNGINIQSVDGWAPMNYITSDDNITSGTLSLRTIGVPVVETDNPTENKENNNLDIAASVMLYAPPRKALAYKWEADGKVLYSIGQVYYKLKEYQEGDKKYIYLERDCIKNDETYKAYKSIKQSYYDGSNVQEILYVYANEDNELIWYQDSEDEKAQKEQHGIALSDDDSIFGFINFGIIGQEKRIEKDKIYCLGISCVSQNANVEIRIGEGSLISEGNYHVKKDSSLLTFTLNDLYGDSSYVRDDDKFWQLLDEGKAAIDIPAETFENNKRFILFRAKENIESPYFIIHSTKKVLVYAAYLFEAYTKGMDCFSFDGKDCRYKYSGRELFGIEQPDGTIGWDDNKSKPFTNEQIRNIIIFEDDIMLGSTYGYQQYYIQRLKAFDTVSKDYLYYDTMGQKEFISEKNIGEGALPLDAAYYTEDDYEVETNFIDLNKCMFYRYSYSEEQQDGKTVKRPLACDCAYSKEGATDTPTKVCFYQKFGYCPYRFDTEKHCRRVRTLNVEKSNRFNILQEISKVFEMYPQFYIQHKSNGKVVKNGEDYDKQVFFITEKGTENSIGFRYEKNLKDITRDINSEQIVTKLYVLDVDSDLSKTGLCSIKTAEDNPSKDSYIIDLSYYIEKGQLDADEVEQDLWGVYPAGDNNELPSGFLRQLGYYNEQYDRITNNIINLQDASFSELQANLIVNLEGIVTAQEQLVKLKKQIDAYSTLSRSTSLASSTFISYQTKYAEQQAILVQLIADTFFTDGEIPPVGDPCYDIDGINKEIFDEEDYTIPSIWFKCIENLNQVKESWVDKHMYKYGMLGQFNKEYTQIQMWKKERSSYLKLINKISAAFYRKYEPYLKEGTWSDSNYLTDNAYYFGALDVAAEGAIPKVSYSTSVIDIAPLSEEWNDIYQFELGDTTYVEDIGMFGVNQKTGLPNRLKVLIAELSDNLDDPSKNSVKVQNFTTQFEDLFQQVTASVQSLTFNENIYKRSSNFTALQNVSKDSLQGTLDSNDLTLLNTDERNIVVDNMGTRGSSMGNHANKYKLDGQGLFFSNDGGEHWSVGVGPSGINADYIKVGTLDAGRVRIVDNDYLYFTWDKNGIVAYRDPFSVNSNESNADDAAIFNKYGLSIVQGGNIRLRAGYAFNGTSSVIDSELEQNDEVGFYLYDSAGNVIFSTTQDTGDTRDGSPSAKMYLIGEFLATNNGGALAGNSSYRYGHIYDVKTATAYLTAPVNCFFSSLTNLNEDKEYDWTFAATGLNKQSQALACAAYYYKNGNNTDIINITVLGERHSIDLSKCSLTEITNKLNYGRANAQDINLFKINKLYEFKTEKDTIYIATSSGIKEGQTVEYYYYIQSLDTIQKITYLQERANTSESDQFSTQLKLEHGFGWIDLNTITTQIIRQDSNLQLNMYQFRRDVDFYIGNNDKLYRTIQAVPAEIDEQGAVALYINNTSDLTKPSGKQSRLFVCCKNDGSNVRNIFSILKNGNLYIGGEIKSANAVKDFSAMTLPNDISVDGAGIEIDGNTLRIDFNNIQNKGGMGLGNYIDEQLTGYTTYGHYHELYFPDIPYYYHQALFIEPEGSSIEDRFEDLVNKLNSFDFLLNAGCWNYDTTSSARM